MYIDLPDKRYYKIGEVAKAFGVNSSLIRFWESEFDSVKPKKSAKGDRMFSQEDVKELKLIYQLVKEKGFTLEGAKLNLKQKRKEHLQNADLIARLEKIKHELLKIKSQL